MHVNASWRTFISEKSPQNLADSKLADSATFGDSAPNAELDKAK